MPYWWESESELIKINVNYQPQGWQRAQNVGFPNLFWWPNYLIDLWLAIYFYFSETNLV